MYKRRHIPGHFCLSPNRTLGIETPNQSAAVRLPLASDRVPGGTPNRDLLVFIRVSGASVPRGSGEHFAPVSQGHQPCADKARTILGGKAFDRPVIADF